MPDASALAPLSSHLGLFQGVCLGVMAAMGAYYLALFYAVRDRCFLYFSGYVLGIGAHFLLSAGNGAGIAPPSGWGPDAIAFLLTCTAGAASYVLFLRQFLTPVRLPRGLDRAFAGIAVAQAAGPVVAVAGGWPLWSAWVAGLTVPLTCVTFAALSVAWRRRYRPAYWLIAAISVTAVSSLTYVAPIFGFPVVPAAESVVLAGVAVQALLLGLAVAWRLRDLRAEHDRTQAAQRAAERKSTALREALQMKSNLLSFAAHDLRSPLTGILGFADLAREEATDPAVREYADHILASARRLDRLVGDILTSAELGSAGVTVRTQPTDIGEFVEGAVRTYAPAAAAKEQRLDIHVERGHAARVDRDRFQEVVDNLVSNAVKYTPSGGGVRVEVRREGPDVRVRVADTGPGFSLADREEMFKPFKRLSARPTAGEPSTGLGLAIAKQIVDLHEGRIWLESGTGGAAFSVCLPALAEPLAPEVASPDGAPPEAAPPEAAPPEAALSEASGAYRS